MRVSERFLVQDSFWRRERNLSGTVHLTLADLFDIGRNPTGEPFDYGMPIRLQSMILELIPSVHKLWFKLCENDPCGR